MKKFIMLLLIMVLAIFAFAGCDGITPAEGEGEGESEGETGGFCPEISISGSVVIDGKTYVRGLNIYDMEETEELDVYDDIILTVTYSTPTEGTEAYLGGLAYGAIDTIVEEVIKDSRDIGLLDLEIPMFPNEDNTVYTGSLKPYLLGWQTDCTAFLIKVVSCAGDCVCKLPFIVDNRPPYAKIKIENVDDACDCGGCSLKISSDILEPDCMDDISCCGDKCSGLSGWSIAIYDKDPFNDCCATPCVEPIDTCSGTICPIECITECLTEEKYYIVANLVDEVGLKKEYYATVTLDTACGIEVIEHYPGGWMNQCTEWNENKPSSDNTIGDCGDLELII